MGTAPWFIPQDAKLPSAYRVIVLTTPQPSSFEAIIAQEASQNEGHAHKALESGGPAGASNLHPPAFLA
jgi:hypothetical protein